MTNIGSQFDFKPLNLVTCPISAERQFSFEIGTVGNLKKENFRIVNININQIAFVKNQLACGLESIFLSTCVGLNFTENLGCCFGTDNHFLNITVV